MSGVGVGVGKVIGDFWRPHVAEAVAVGQLAGASKRRSWHSAKGGAVGGGCSGWG